VTGSVLPTPDDTGTTNSRSPLQAGAGPAATRIGEKFIYPGDPNFEAAFRRDATAGDPTAIAELRRRRKGKR
jgi:hypothetical protein